MTKKIINIGAAANDRQGDSLRSAFTKVNENFTELYVALGLDTGSLNIGAFEFTGSTISTTDSSSVTIDQATTVSSNLTVGGDLLPQTNLGGNLGSPTQKWKSLYLSSSTVYFNDIPMSISSDGTLRINGSTVSGGSGGSYNDLTDKPTIPTNTNQLTNGAGFITSTDRLVNGSAEFRLQLNGGTPFVTFPAHVGESVTVQGSEISSENSALVLSSFDNMVMIGANAQGPRKNWEFGTNGELTLPDIGGNSVIRSAGNTLELWSDADGNSGFSATRNADTDILSTNSVSIKTDMTGTEYVWTFGSNGNLTLPRGNIVTPGGFIGFDSLDDINFNLDLISLNSVKIIAGGPQHTWAFGEDGSLTFPDNTVQTTAWTGLPSYFNGDMTGSVFADDSTLLVDGISGIVPNAELAKSITQVIDSNATVNTSATVTTNNSYTNTVDFSTDVDPGVGYAIAGWYQRNSEQIEFALFGPSSFQTYLLGLALGRTVIVTYSTGSGNQTLTRTLTQTFSATGQADPANPTWGRVSGRIDATLPADQTGIVSINFPEYSTSSNTWTFGTNGNLVLPYGGAIEASTGNMFLKGTLGSSSSAGVQDFTENSRAYAWVGAFTVETNRGVSTKTWNFRNTGELQFPDGAKYEGKTVKMPTTTTGTTNSFVWEFSDNVIGSDKITLNWNLLASDTSTFYIGTTHSTDGKYLILDGTDQSLGYFTGGTGGGGKLIFGESTNGGVGGVNDIELKSTNGDVRIATDNNNRWSFDDSGNFSFPDSSVQTTAYPGTLAAAKFPYYADTSARDTAIPSPVNGMVCIVAGSLYFYGNAQWLQLAGTP